MKDNQHLMIELVKIVERFPELYDLNLDSYRTRFSEDAWAKVAACVQAELNEECTGMVSKYFRSGVIQQTSHTVVIVEERCHSMSHSAVSLLQLRFLGIKLSWTSKTIVSDKSFGDCLHLWRDVI